MNRMTGLALASALLLASGFGATRAEAFMPKPMGLEGTAIVTPAAMCGRSCMGGGRYYPGPPGVCAQYGLNYCGSSRGGPGPGVGVVVPGVGVGVVGPGGVYVGPGGGGGGGCRTTTVRRPDGTVITRRSC